MRREQIDTRSSSACGEGRCVVVRSLVLGGSRPPWPFLGTLICWSVFSASLTSAGEAERYSLPEEDPCHRPPPCTLFLFPSWFSRPLDPFFCGEEARIDEGLFPVEHRVGMQLGEKGAPHIFQCFGLVPFFQATPTRGGMRMLSGRSFYRAPVLSIHNIPSNNKRSSALGRPLYGTTGLLGMRGSIFFHCSSVRYTTRLLTGLTSGEMHIPKI